MHTLARATCDGELPVIFRPKASFGAGSCFFAFTELPLLSLPAPIQITVQPKDCINLELPRQIPTPGTAATSMQILDLRLMPKAEKSKGVTGLHTQLPREDRLWIA